MSARSKRFLAEISERLQHDPGLPQVKPTDSYWQIPKHDTVATVQSAKLDVETDVIIIGSGITGCSIARNLLEGDDSIKVVVLEARSITSGATGRNGGHVKAVPEYSYAELNDSLGKEAADEVIRFTLANVDALMDVKSHLDPELQRFCEMRRVEALNLFTDDEAYHEFEELLGHYERDHKKRGYLVGREELEGKYDVHNAAGAYVASAGAGWPYRFITGIFAEMLQQYKGRLKLEAYTPVEHIDAEESSPYYTVYTPRGHITARTVIHATNGHAGHLLPGLRGPLYPVRGQMTAQRPTQRFDVQGGTRSWSIHYGSGFDYMTQSEQSGEIFLGGGLGQAYQHGLHEVGNVRDDVNSPLALAHLSGIVNAVWGKEERESASSEVLSAWTGVMGFTTDGLPLVGKLPKEGTTRNGDGEWIAAGFNGYGMANAWLSGKHVADQILGKQDDGVLPRCYKISTERLSKMKPEDGARHWMTALALD